MARAAEEVGFDSIWVGDHALYRGDGRPERGPWDCWTLLAALAAATAHVDAWNTWYTHYGNTAEGFAEQNAAVSEQAERAGRDPAELERSACVLVHLEGGVDLRPEQAPPVPAARLAEHLRALADAGADE